jgi:DNA helicase-2/ATP-dependent DNA helicase PcrA
MTRAMERLTITSAAERLRYGSRTYGVPSRFLAEIPPEVTEQVPSARRSRGSRTSRWQERGESRRGEHYDYSYAQGEASEGGDIAPGLRVRHSHFGTGTVLQVIGHGPSQKLKIRFERAGVKTLVVRYANLELG